ncbi:hypothetical protein, partial [Serratia fonticola]
PDGSTRQQTVTTDENGIASLPVTSDKAGSVKVEADVGGVTSSTELSFVADNSTLSLTRGFSCSRLVLWERAGVRGISVFAP